MLKIIAVLSCVLAFAYGGIYSAPLAYHAPAPAATSYQSNVLVSHGAVPVVAAVKAAPVYHAPAIVKTPIYHAPAILKAAPVYDVHHY